MRKQRGVILPITRVNECRRMHDIEAEFGSTDLLSSEVHASRAGTSVALL